MKKLFVAFLLFVSFLHADALVYEVDGAATNRDLKAYLSYGLLPFDMPADAVFQQRHIFIPLENGTPQGVKALWLSVSFQNMTDTAQSIVLKTFFEKIAYLDFYVFEDGVLLQTYARGFMQNSDRYDFFTRPNAITVDLSPKSSATVLVAMRSPHIKTVDMALLDPQTYLKELLKQAIIMVLLCGIIFSAIAYNFSLYMSVRLKAFIYYALGGLVFLVQVYFQFGFSVWLNPGFPPVFSTVGFFVSASLIYLPMILFAQSFFETKQRFLFLYRVLQTLFVVFSVFSVLFITALHDARIFALAPFWSMLHPVTLSVFTLLGIVATIKRFPGAPFYLAGQAIFYSLITYNIVLGMIKESGAQNGFLLYVVGLSADIIFIALALGTKIKEIKKRQEAHKKAMQISAQEKAIAITVKNISHQWSVPLIQLGALMAKLELSLEQNRMSRTDNIQTIHKANDLISYMDEMTQKYRSMYKTDAKPEVIDFAQLMEKVQMLLKPMLQKDGAVLTWERDEGVMSLVSSANVLMQVLIILIDNAVSVASQRGIRQPSVVVKNAVQKGRHVIRVEDNAGGIEIKPIERIFEQDISRKKDGLGYGLYLAKQLSENVLKGEITAQNTKNGACFVMMV